MGKIATLSDGKIATLDKNDPREGDFRQTISRLIGDISKYELGPRQLLAPIYLRPQKSQGGILIPRSNLEEDFYQSKVILVAKVGEGAVFCGKPVEVGDWLVVRPSDCWALEVNGVRCRQLFDSEIRARIAFPDIMVW